MAIPDSKQSLLNAIDQTYSKLLVDLRDIPIELTKTVELKGHAKDVQMSVCNLLSYLIGWGKLVLKWHENEVQNQKIDFPETGFKWNELGLLAQKFYADFETDNFPELLEKLEITKNEIFELVESKTNDELYGSNWYDKWTMGRMISLNTSSPYKNARIRLRKWKREKGLL